MGTYSTVDCNEVKGTNVENYSIEGGIQASVQLEVTAANKNALIDDLLSNQREWPNAGLSIKPRAYAAVAEPFSSEGGVTGQTHDWDFYNVTVQYSTDSDRTLVSESLEPDAEFIRLDHRFFRWETGGPLTEGEAPGYLKPKYKLVRKLYQQASIPSILLTPGVVHNASYTSTLLGITFNAETLLLLARPMTRQITTAGSAGYNYEVAFSYKPDGWNKYWRPSTQTYERIVLASGTAYNSYPPTDLSSILV